MTRSTWMAWTTRGLSSLMVLAWMGWAAPGVATAQAEREADQAPPAQAERTRPEAERRPASRANGFEGYDFGQVVERLGTSVSPLQREMDASFRVFTDSMTEATDLLDEGKPKDAVELSLSAMRGLLAVRDEVTEPMWEGQEYLIQQVSHVRDRLARAMSAVDETEIGVDAQAEQAMDVLAEKIAQETDELRRRRLVAHYRTVRSLGQIRQMADRMSPDQRALWGSVLQVLEEAALTHQQVLMGTEVLFAQLDATAANLEEYVALMDTVDGAAQLLGVVRGEGADGRPGVVEFAQSMQELQQRLVGFSGAVEAVLEGGMQEIESQIMAVREIDVRLDPTSSDGDVGVISTRIDDELQARMDRVSQREQ